MDEDTRSIIQKQGRLYTERILSVAMKSGFDRKDISVVMLSDPEADAGLTGRKLMVDSCGAFVPHSGDTFSGKDLTKMDRSGRHMARYIAKKLVEAGLCRKCQVHRLLRRWAWVPTQG